MTKVIARYLIVVLAMPITIIAAVAYFFYIAFMAGWDGAKTDLQKFWE